MRLALSLCALVLVAPVAVSAGGGISGTRAKATAAQLAALGPRPAGSAAERRAGDLVARELRRHGYRVVFQAFSLPRGGSSRNVVALPVGRPHVLVVAHLDGVAEGPAANDNGSGVAALLELARALRGERSVMLVATGAEERVETGSRIHLGAQRVLQGLSRRGRAGIRLAVSLDMVGVGTRLHVRGLEATPNRSARALLAAGEASYLVDPGHSDHAELTRAGIPAAWIQWREDACWHEPCDTAERLEPAKLEAAARLVLRAIESL